MPLLGEQGKAVPLPDEALPSATDLVFGQIFNQALFLDVEVEGEQRATLGESLLRERAIVVWKDDRGTLWRVAGLGALAVVVMRSVVLSMVVARIMVFLSWMNVLMSRGRGVRVAPRYILLP